MATPTLTPAEVAELQQNAKTPEQLGIEMRVTERRISFEGVNAIQADENVTIPLLRVPTDQPGAPGSLYRVPVMTATVNGKSGVRVLLDSGSNRNLFGYTSAHSLGIPIIAGLKPIAGYGIGGAVDNYAAVIDSIQIGSVALRKVIAIVGPDAQVLNFMRGLQDQAQVMILGVNALRRLSYLTIDSLRGKVILGATDSYLPDDTLKFMTTVPLHWVGELPAVDVSIDGTDPVLCLLDTGGDYGMILPRTKAIELDYWKPGKGSVTTSRGVGGASLSANYLITQARVGGETLDHIPGNTTLVGPEPGGGQVFLGNYMLRHYRLTFDFKRSVLWLER
ncbi:MAG TPA: retropepsin-like aspartic protease [Verrucomicrobiae bacterium]|nr:retropepsin-like aspartic protease [Verrucomicrobiae bacterium]